MTFPRSHKGWVADLRKAPMPTGLLQGCLPPFNALHLLMIFPRLTGGERRWGGMLVLLHGADVPAFLGEMCQLHGSWAKTQARKVRLCPGRPQMSPCCPIHLEGGGSS